MEIGRPAAEMGPGVVRLFGVDVGGGDEGTGKVKKSSSMPDLNSAGNLLPPGDDGLGNGYASDDLELAPRQQKRRRRKAEERKKGIPWTEEEHRKFLGGLRLLGKGDWRGISKSFVTSTTATQVASHAQKHFLRQTNPGKKKHRASLFDVGVADYHADGLLPSPQSQCVVASNSNRAPTQEIIHPDRGEVPLPSYPVAGGILGTDSIQVGGLTNYFIKRPKAHAGTSVASMASVLETASSVNSLELGIAVDGLELSIAPPRGHGCAAAGAIKVL